MAEVLSPIRQKAKTFIEGVRGNLPLWSDDKDKAQTYYNYTHYTETHLKAFWDNGDNLTSCNAFAGEYFRYLGGIYILLGFKMDVKNLPDNGYAHTWVESADGHLPHYGDICLHTRDHISILIEASPKWITLQGGIGGSGKETRRDGIGFGTDGWNPSALKGWVDLDAMFPPKPSVVAWLLGWWKVTWDEDTYYYYFDSTWSVRWTETRPRAASTVQVQNVGGSGTFTYTGGMLQIKWRSGSVEQFWPPDLRPVEFWGKHNDHGVLHVQRMD